VTDAALAGVWLKESADPCSSSYPDELELHASGRVTGRMRPGAPLHPVWDVGTLERLDDRHVAISRFDDAVGRYAFALEGDRLTFTDDAGCTFSYRRAEG
jgi:hypothetical protein